MQIPDSAEALCEYVYDLGLPSYRNIELFLDSNKAKYSQTSLSSFPPADLDMILDKQELSLNEIPHRLIGYFIAKEVFLKKALVLRPK